MDTKADMRFSALEAKIDASIKQNAKIIGSNTVLQDFVTKDLKKGLSD